MAAMKPRHTAALALVGWYLMVPLPLRADGPIAVPGTADVEMAPSSSPLIVRGTADTPPEYELWRADQIRAVRVELLRQKYKLLLEKTQLNESREGGPDIEELKEEEKGLEALKRELEKAEDKLNKLRRFEERLASHVSAPSGVSGPSETRLDGWVAPGR
jgi:hypothetical protein